MSPIRRRLLAVLIAAITVIIALIWMEMFGKTIFVFAWEHLSQDVPLSKAGGPRPDTYDVSAHNYYLFFGVALVLVTGGSAALIVLVPKSNFTHRAWIYFAFLVVILPATFYNYRQGDVVLDASLQAGLNLVLIFLATTIAIWLSYAPAPALDTKVLKYITLMLLLLAGVFVPTIFSVIWLFYKAGLLSLDKSREISFQSITGLASVASALIAWLNYRRDKKTLEVEKPKIITGIR
ncbi:hypothetical protein DC20_21910 (plasmid) [Rufibacter tibetensis]|uniref:DUF998 domain-containing protein n=2 Tax=Rufibacter tibetensis TaxID=512763 RepID=A0A0P0CI51_9BACT|nr:hypothetical protein DC20_21910 [Rufibacter tibetensis]